MDNSSIKEQNCILLKNQRETINSIKKNCDEIFSSFLLLNALLTIKHTVLYMFQLRGNRPFPSCWEPHYKSEARCKTFYMKVLFVYELKLIFITKT